MYTIELDITSWIRAITNKLFSTIITMYNTPTSSWPGSVYQPTATPKRILKPYAIT